MRRDRFAPIGEYGLLGDGRSVALVAADGSVDWWAVPAMDAPPVFAAILGPGDGGAFALEPAVPYQAERRYLPGTNVLETTFRTSGGAVRVVDGLNQDVDGPLAWTELAREVRGDAGEVPMRWRVAQALSHLALLMAACEIAAGTSRDPAEATDGEPTGNERG